MTGSRSILIVLLASAMAVIYASGASADGRKIFEARKCGACHQVKGPAAEKTIKDQLSKKGPELWYAGSKFRPGFLEKWLSEPRPIRPLAYNSIKDPNPGDHPALPAPEAKEVSQYLMTLKSPDVKAVGIQPSENPRGRVIFIKKQSCYGCHTVRARGKVAGGLSGPALSGAGKRLNPDWIYAYLSNPKAFKPVKMMPVYAGILKDDEIRDLAAYVAGLN